MPSPSPPTTSTPNSDNFIILGVKLAVAGLHSQLQKLPITSRLCHHFLILHLLLSFIDLAPSLSLCGEAVLVDNQYWRLLTFSFADPSWFLAVFGALILSDVVSRLEYQL